MRREPDRYGWPQYRTQQPTWVLFAALAGMVLEGLWDLAGELVGRVRRGGRRG